MKAAMSSKSSNNSKLSIGAVSNATGIPSATLRTWERRYGFPNPERSDSGHRLYDPSIIERLRLVDRALDAGYRPSNVVGMSTRDLHELLETSGLDRGGYRSEHEERGPELVREPDDWLKAWIDAAHRLDGDTLQRYFRDSWNRIGGIEFLGDRVAPFLVRLGEAWESGELKVVHEHYTSECLRDFLTSQWRPLADRSRGPKVVCATPEGEYHSIGLHMAALVLAMAGWQIIFLGMHTPREDMLMACEAESVDALAVSISSSYDSELASSALGSLREELPGGANLLAGGRGTPANFAGTKQFPNFDALYGWAFERAR